MTELSHDTLKEWRFGIACLRAQHLAGRPLSTSEMIEIVDDDYVAMVHGDNDVVQRSMFGGGE